MTPLEMESRIVRQGSLVASPPAFSDPLAQGDVAKDDFAILGGETTAADRHVHITETPGFNLTATRQAPGCVNALHSHSTAETAIVLSGRWRFFWGRQGTAGAVVLEPGDLFNIPTTLFRGFENIGDSHGMVMTVLGGDDAGGGVIWAPAALRAAEAAGLILGEDGGTYDTHNGRPMPEAVKALLPLGDAELGGFGEPSARQVVPAYVARYLDLMAMSGGVPVAVVGPEALVRDKPGFEVEFLRDGSAPDKPGENTDHEVLIVTHGHWRVRWRGGSTTLAPGDTMAMPPRFAYGMEPAMSGEASLYRIRSNADPAGETWRP